MTLDTTPKMMKLLVWFAAVWGCLLLGSARAQPAESCSSAPKVGLTDSSYHACGVVLTESVSFGPFTLNFNNDTSKGR